MVGVLRKFREIKPKVAVPQITSATQRERIAHSPKTSRLCGPIYPTTSNDRIASFRTVSRSIRSARTS